MSGNPGGRPRGLSRAVRELVGEDGGALAVFWFEVMTDPAAKMRDRLEASKLLADRGFGKTLVHVLDTGDEESADDRSMEVKRWPSDERVIELGKLYNEFQPDDPLAVLYRQFEAEAQERAAKSALPALKDIG